MVLLWFGWADCWLLCGYRLIVLCPICFCVYLIGCFAAWLGGILVFALCGGCCVVWYWCSLFSLVWLSSLGGLISAYCLCSVVLYCLLISFGWGGFGLGFGFRWVLRVVCGFLVRYCWRDVLFAVGN